VSDELTTPIHYTEPYLDAHGKGFMISLATQMRTPTDGGDLFKGAVGSDVSIGMLQDMIDKIKSGKTGQAHLIDNTNDAGNSTHAALGGMVIASPQWDPWAASAELFWSTYIAICPLTDNTRLSQSQWTTILESARDSTEAQSTNINGCFVEYVKIEVGDKFFVLLISTPLTEITYSIDKSRSDIDSAADELFASTAVICVICFAVVFVFIVYVAHEIAGPLSDSARTAGIVASNIGSGDLFQGVDIEKNEKACYGIGEVEILKESFLAMLVDSWNARNVPDDLTNPFKMADDPTAEQILLLESTTTPVPARDTLDPDPRPISLSINTQDGSSFELSNVNRNMTIGQLKKDLIIDKYNSLSGRH
jgi:hypothetical protein